MVIDSQTRELEIKLALIGLPASGKRQILQDWSSQQGDGRILHTRVGEALLYRASFRWTNLPRDDWSIKLTAYTAEGEISHSAISEMLLKDADGIAFVAPIDPDRAQAIRDSLVNLGQVLGYLGHHISEIPVVMHYHQAERLPGFDPNLLSDFLGIPRGAVPHVMTRSDDGSSLTSSFALLLQKVMEKAEEMINLGEVPA
ncbi:MAG: hypothetical protein ACI9NQ_000231 [Paracoccaceae bacterium]|jgi:hypothetical protein